MPRQRRTCVINAHERARNGTSPRGRATTTNTNTLPCDQGHGPDAQSFCKARGIDLQQWARTTPKHATAQSKSWHRFPRKRSIRQRIRASTGCASTPPQTPVVPASRWSLMYCRANEFAQCRWSLRRLSWVLLSSKMCPKCPPQPAQVISTLSVPSSARRCGDMRTCTKGRRTPRLTHQELSTNTWVSGHADMKVLQTIDGPRHLGPMPTGRPDRPEKGAWRGTVAQTNRGNKLPPTPLASSSGVQQHFVDKSFIEGTRRLT